MSDVYKVKMVVTLQEGKKSQRTAIKIFDARSLQGSNNQECSLYLFSLLLFPLKNV